MSDIERTYHALLTATWTLGWQIFLQRLGMAPAINWTSPPVNPFLPFLAQPEATEQPTIH